MEQWRDVAGFSGLYQVSDQGRVFQCPKRRSGGIQLDTGQIVAPKLSAGHPVVVLTGSNGAQGFQVAQLVAESFHGVSRQDHRQLQYKDGDCYNCSSENICVM